MEATASKGYQVQFWDGKWEVKEAQYYDFSLRNDMPVIAEDKTSIKSVIERAILNAVLDLVGSAKMDGKGEKEKSLLYADLDDIIDSVD